MVARKVRDNSILRWFKRKFLTGLLVLLPTALTAYVLYRIFVWVDGFLKPIIARYPFFDIPGLGFVAVILIILLAGVFGGGFFGRTLLRWLEGGFEKLPMVSRIYVAIKQISEVFLRQERTVFERVVLVEYPRPGIWMLGFVTSRWRFRAPGREEGEYITAFLPTSPNPTTGFLIIVPPAEAIPTDLSVEEAFKVVISAGAVVPGAHRPGSPEAPTTPVGG
jgi:uncharacterized membrane protein